ncbi:probable E3 ubiquitin-protein ligase makorin-2 isoform X2 [Oxyura jamaicensis]|uniref:probable E3 ubiquitin-protein ligase makorin-2 isoform X2 n=1 Tax=Oxyura jamaicensis TaxID=8884 RepID=UPI0015A55B58|nr:probable E3 ubiquitin-protein ligase makorin-2 isoform X2 [Oxyura jamaicensis]
MESGSQTALGALRARGGCLRPLCRNFVRGSCRRGRSCRFSHDRKSAPVCRYFQRGACGYGERCSYQHVQEEPVPARNRYSPVPNVAPGRQGWRGAWRTSVPAVPRETQAAFRHLGVEVEEEEDDKENIPVLNNPPGRAVWEEFIPSRARSAAGSHPRGLGLDPNSPDPSEAAVETATWAECSQVPAEQGAAATPVPAVAALRARSEAVVCGICMERVYEKALPEERLFGILPNCGHAFCVGCIRTWRRSRDFQSTVIKACPECRVTSSYYIPHKYWVSDASEKEQLIESFKARTGRIRCKFFIQNRGRCPFRSDCIYLHELPGGRPPQRGLQRPRMRAELNPSPSESSDEEDDFCLLDWAVTRALLEVDFLYSSYGHEMLFGDSSTSD